jgi:predicted alpha/beta superfamily hydrolase
MKLFHKYLLIPLALFSTIGIMVSGCSKEKQAEPRQPIAATVSSVYTGTDYAIRILLPDNFNADSAYHVVYLLDGDDYFGEMTKVIQAQYRYNTILVGIGYKGTNRRMTDFTYPADKISDKSGGGIQFVKFLTKELLPFIKAQGIQATQQTLAGHSLGAYLALYLTFQTEIANPFNNIIAISPSLFWHDAYIFQLEASRFNQSKNLPVHLYLAVGDIEGVTMNTHFKAFINKLTLRNYTGLQLNYELLRNRSHNNTPITGFEKALSTIQ